MSEGEGKQDRERRRTLLVLVVATAVGSAGLAAGGTAGALLGAEIFGTEAAAGLPLGLLVLGGVAVGQRTKVKGVTRSSKAAATKADRKG